MINFIKNLFKPTAEIPNNRVENLIRYQFSFMLFPSGFYTDKDLVIRRLGEDRVEWVRMVYSELLKKFPNKISRPIIQAITFTEVKYDKGSLFIISFPFKEEESNNSLESKNLNLTPIVLRIGIIYYGTSLIKYYVSCMEATGFVSFRFISSDETNFNLGELDSISADNFIEAVEDDLSIKGKRLIGGKSTTPLLKEPEVLARAEAVRSEKETKDQQEKAAKQRRRREEGLKALEKAQAAEASAVLAAMDMKEQEEKAAKQRRRREEMHKAAQVAEFAAQKIKAEEEAQAQAKLTQGEFDLASYIAKHHITTVSLRLNLFSKLTQDVLKGGSFELVGIESIIEGDIFNFTYFLFYLKTRISTETYQELEKLLIQNLILKIDHGASIERKLNTERMLCQAQMWVQRDKNYLKDKMYHYDVEIRNIENQDVYFPKYTFVSFYMRSLIEDKYIIQSAEQVQEKNIVDFSLALKYGYVQMLKDICTSFCKYLEE